MELTFIKFLILLQMCSFVRLFDESLVLVHVIFRHCDRTPEIKELYSNSKYYDESNFASGYGQLTNEGKRRCYNIGKDLRKRYDGFLNASYHYSIIESRSTDFERTKESLQLVLAGLFPPTEELIWMEGMNWIPVATNYDKRDTDKVLYPLGNPVYEQELSRYIQEQGEDNVATIYADLLAMVSEEVQEPISFEKLAYLTRGLEIMESLGLELPAWAKTLFPIPLKDIMIEYFYDTIGTKQLRRLYGGYLLRKIVEDTEKKINGTLDPGNRKMFIYGGHDFNIEILLVILESYDNIVPSVGSSLIFELHNVNGTYGFKIFYFRNRSEEYETIAIPALGDFLKLNEFKAHYHEFLQLDDLDEYSSSLRLTGSFSLIFTLFYINSQL